MIDEWFYNVIITVLKKNIMQSVCNSVDHECRQRPCCQRQDPSLGGSGAEAALGHRYK